MNHSTGHQGDQDQSDQYVHGPEQRCQRIPCQSSGGVDEWVRLRSRHTQKSDGELAIVALREAVQTSRQSDTILEMPPKGDSQSNGAAENAVREAEGMIRTW